MISRFFGCTNYTFVDSALSSGLPLPSAQRWLRVGQRLSDLRARLLATSLNSLLGNEDLALADEVLYPSPTFIWNNHLKNCVALLVLTEDTFEQVSCNDRPETELCHLFLIMYWRQYNSCSYSSFCLLLLSFQFGVLGKCFDCSTDIDLSWIHVRFGLKICSSAIQVFILKSSDASYLESTFISPNGSCIYSILSKQIWERRVIRSFLVNSSVKSTPQMRCLGGIVAHCSISDVLLCSFVSRG